MHRQSACSNVVFSFWDLAPLMQQLPSGSLLPFCVPVHLRERQLGAGSLPVEILAQIFTHLDFPSVRSVRLTCKTFYSVTKTQQFWYHHIDKLTKTYHLSLPEDQLDSYTLDELEQWTVRRSRAIDVFVNCEQPRFHKRTLDLRPQDLCKLHSWDFQLIPGGRWLLVCHPSAALYFLDLDCSNPAPRLLFDIREIDNEIPQPEFVNFCIWIDRGAPRLSLRLALLVDAKDISRMYTSRVDLSGHGVDATLVVSHIAMFRNFDLRLWTLGFALNDRYLVHVWSDDSKKTQIGVYDYCQARGCPDHSMTHDYDHRSELITTGLMEFIHDDILAIQCLRLHTLSIFKIGPSTSVKLLHRIGMYSFPCSVPRWTPQATVITMANSDSQEIQGLVIPHDLGRPPTIVTLGRCNKRKSCVYTLGTRVFVAKDKLHEVISHDWDYNSPTNLPPTLTSLCQEDLTTNFLTFDEDTGRFLAYPCRQNLVIYDIV